jgi:hypothetical protein
MADETIPCKKQVIISRQIINRIFTKFYNNRGKPLIIVHGMEGHVERSYKSDAKMFPNIKFVKVCAQFNNLIQYFKLYSFIKG